MIKRYTNRRILYYYYRYRPSSMVRRSVTVVSPAKTAEPIEMPFGLTTQVAQGAMY